MKAHRLRVLVMLLAVAAAANSADAGAAKGPRLTLPADWTAGAKYRYRATWKREVTRWPAAVPVPGSMNAEVTGEVTIAVVAKSASGYDLRWETVLAPASAGPTRVAEGDVDAGGGELWRYALTLPLDLALDTSSDGATFALRNERTVRDLLTKKKREVLGQVMGGSSTAELPDTDVSAEVERQHVAPFFSCTKLDLRLDGPESWSEPHPNPDIGAAVPIEHRREVIGYDPRSPRITVRTITEPNAGKWQAWMERQFARGPGGAEMRQVTGEMTVRFETTCTVDRHSGWPVKVEQRASSSTRMFEGAEIVRLELLEGADQRPPRPE